MLQSDTCTRVTRLKVVPSMVGPTSMEHLVALGQEKKTLFYGRDRPFFCNLLIFLNKKNCKISRFLSFFLVILAKKCKKKKKKLCRPTDRFLESLRPQNRVFFLGLMEIFFFFSISIPGLKIMELKIEGKNETLSVFRYIM